MLRHCNANPSSIMLFAARNDASLILILLYVSHILFTCITVLGFTLLCGTRYGCFFSTFCGISTSSIFSGWTGG